MVACAVALLELVIVRVCRAVKPTSPKDKTRKATSTSIMLVPRWVCRRCSALHIWTSIPDCQLYVLVYTGLWFPELV